MNPLQSFSYRVGSLADFEATPLHQPEGLSEAELRRWTSDSSATQQWPTASHFSACHAAITGYGSEAPSRQLVPLLASKLAAVAHEAARQLLEGGGEPDSGNPRAKLALHNCFKLSLSFLCHLQRKAAEQEGIAPAPTKGKKAGGQQADAGGRAQRLQLRHDIMRSLAGLYELLLAKPVLPPGAELSSAVRAAEQLVRGAAVACMAQLPQHVDRDSKATEEALRRSCTGIMVKALSSSNNSEPPVQPALHAVHDLLALATQPQQKGQAPQDVAAVAAQLLLLQPKAGISLLAHLFDRAGELYSSQQEGAGAQLDGILTVLAAVAASEGSGPNAVLLYCKELAALLQSPRSSTRRLVLDIFSSALQRFSAQPTVVQNISVLVRVLTHALSDKDASLRAKALGCLERSAASLVGLGRGTVAGAQQAEALAERLAARLCDKSLMVRKRALQLLSALLTLDLPAAWHQALGRCVLPVGTELLGVTPDSELSSGEEASQALCRAVLAMASHSSSSSTLTSLLHLSVLSTNAAASDQIYAALAALVLWGPATERAGGRGGAESRVAEPQDHILTLAGMLVGCVDKDMTRLATIVQQSLQSSKQRGGAATTTRRAVLVQSCYGRLHTLSHVFAGGTGPSPSHAFSLKELSGALRVLYVLRPVSSTAEPAVASSEAHMLLNLVQTLLSASPALQPTGGAPLAQEHQETARMEQHGAHPEGSEAEPSIPGSGAELQLALQWALKTSAQALQQAVGIMQAEALQQLESKAMALVSAVMVSRVADSTLAAALQVMRALPDPQAASLELLNHLGQAILSDQPAASDLPTSLVADTPAFVFDAEQGMALQAGTLGSKSAQCGPAQHECALVGLLQLLAAMAATYEQEKARFKQQLKAEAGGPAQQAPGPAGGQEQPSRQDVPASTGEEAGFDYMQAEDEAHKHEAAAQHFLDELLAAGDTPPASYLPLLEALLQTEGMPAAAQAAAVRCLGRLAVLSQALCTAHLPTLEACLASSRPAAVRAAAVVELAAIVDAFPSIYGSKLGLIGQLVVQPGGNVVLRQQAAAAYSRLLLQNKLKLQGMLAVVGEGLAGPDAKVSRILRHALSHILQASGPKERARIVLDLFHQTPLRHRAAVVEELAGSLLCEGDLRSDLLVGQAAQAFFTASASAAGGGSEGAEAAARLLSRLKPSAKVLAAFRTHVEAWGGNHQLSPAVLQHLQAFVGNHDGPTSATPATAAEAVGEQGALPAAAAAKRKRPAAAAKKQQGGGEGLRQQVMDLLARLGAPRRTAAPARSLLASRAASVVPSESDWGS